MERLQKQGHELTIAYLTSGNLAVPDTDVRNALELMIELGEAQGFSHLSYAKSVEKQLDDATDSIEALDTIAGEVTRIRVESLDG